MRAIMRAYPFVTMITLHEGEPWVSHLPVLYDNDGSPNGKLTGHMARANRQWRHLAGGQTALIIFHGPHRYISPSWYITKPNVPTWNYATVHARGKARMIEDDDAVHAILEKIRMTIRKAAPNAEETIKYQMPTFTLQGNLVHFAAFKNHIGFYPTSSGTEAFKKELSSYKGAKGSVQFPLEKPIPYDLVKRIVIFRRKENLQKKK